MTSHSAPPVVYPLGRSAFQARVLVIIWLAGLMAATAWSHALRQPDWRVGVSLACILGAGIAAYRGWKNSPTGNIAWDGQSWRWESPGYQTGVAEQQLSVLADFQGVMLLCIQNHAGAGMWLWVEQRSCPERWMDLRRAVYSPVRGVAVSGSMHLSDSPLAPHE